MSPRVQLEASLEDGCFRAWAKTTDSSPPTSHDVAADLPWLKELEQECPEWTEAFKGVPLRDTMGQPSKLIRLRLGNKVHPDKPVQYDVVRPEQPVQYAAVSYVWAQWKDITDVLRRLWGLMERSGLIYCWTDQLCIDQDSPDEKEAEIRRMRDYYSQAAITYVMVPDWSSIFTWELAGFSMSYRQVYIAVEEVRKLKKNKMGIKSMGIAGGAALWKDPIRGGKRGEKFSGAGGSRTWTTLLIWCGRGTSNMAQEKEWLLCNNGV